MAASPRRRPIVGSRDGRRHLRPVQEKRDDDIMNTNDSSIVSKRSVSKLYFPDEPDFYEPFVQKYVRRNPLINRGYWLRMHAIEQAVLRFLNEDSDVSKVIVNLGCGYDPLPFQFWHRHALNCRNATFVDVDYPPLIEKKRDRILAHGLLRDAVLKTNLRPSTPPIYVRSDRYVALGCDLRDLKTLEHVLKTEFDMSSTCFLFVAEVSITYMPLVDANALIRWANTLEHAQFCLLEQYLPQGPDHPFARTMLDHFNKLKTPIHAVHDYHSLTLQKSRFVNAGWPMSTVHNLWELWSDDTFTPSHLRHALNAVEPFDEWEEFALFAGHYFLLVASNTKTETQKNADVDLDAMSRPLNDAPTESVVLTAHAPILDIPTPRRFGAAIALDRNTMAIHGGQGMQHRLASTDVLVRDDWKALRQPIPTPARICHTITRVSDSCALLVGGRTSPSHALSDCWSLQGGTWQMVEELRPARFRHSCVTVIIPTPGSETTGVLVFGGKTSAGQVLDECVLWTPNHGWQIVPVTGPRPLARFGAAISSIGANSGILLGGMRADGTVLDDMWEYSISASPQLHLRFRDRTRDILPAGGERTYARFGASLVPFGGSLLLVGGVTRGRVLSLSEDFVAIFPAAKIRLETPNVNLPKATWPLLIGAGIAPVSEDEVVIVGGGAVCFSMGSFWNNGYFTVTRATRPSSSLWSVSVLQNIGKPEGAGKGSPKQKGKGQKAKNDVSKPKLLTVPRIQIQSSEHFSQLVKDSKPLIIESLDLGPCTELWTLAYLKERLGVDREVVVHECSTDRMTFKDKNFQYVKKSVGDFLDGISQGSQTYLRAVSASQPNKLPTKLEEDFPTIAQDFQLPEVLSSVKETYHSSPLRISGPVSLWLHYDVLANVLCQIVGTKTLQLYPPSDVKYLDYPPGGSSSNTNVLASHDPKLRHTHPHVAHLKPGDVLFIPPMWSHTATPEEGCSIAVNVFFRNLEKGYAAGKDVYGNRDLQAYENGRRDVEKILKAFKGIPDDISNFYLDRLVAELQEKAGLGGDK